MTTQATDGASGETIFLDLRRSDSERLRVQTSHYRGLPRVDLRVYYSAENGVLKPGRAGVTIRPDQIPEIVQALLLAARAIDPKGAN